MSKNADLFFDKDRTRVLEDLDVAPDSDSDATIGLDPGSSSITLRSPDQDEPAQVNFRNDQGNLGAVTLIEAVQAGYLELTAGAGPTVRFDASSDDAALTNPEVELEDDGESKASIKPGRINLLFEKEFPGLAADGSGTITLTNRQSGPGNGAESVLLDGNDSALVLSTTPEGKDGDAGDQEKFGGGELVLQSETDADPDIHVHAKGEPGSKYGVNAENRPRIHLDGPNATLEVGRHRVGTDRPAKEGAVTIRSEYGDEVLRMQTSGVGESEVVFEYSRDSGPSEPRGMIRSHPEGLMVFDAGGHYALLLKDDGSVETRKEVTEDADI